MTSHRTVMIAAAQAVVSSDAVKNYCVTNFGRGLQVVVGAYVTNVASGGVPEEDDSPFLWIYSTGNNEEVAADENFTMRAVVGGVVKASSGSPLITTTSTARTSTANGLIVNGGNKIVEDLRDIIMDVIAASKPGAVIVKMRREENDLSHFPLEWAEFEVDFKEFISITQ